MSVGLSVCPVHCGKTADRIRMPFGIIGPIRSDGSRDEAGGLGIGSREGVLSGTNLGRAIVSNGDYGVRSELRFGVVRAVGRGITVLDGGPRRARGRGGFGRFSSPFSKWEMPLVADGEMFPIRFVCENLTTFDKRIVGKLDSWAFWRYIRFQDQSWGLWEISKNVTKPSAYAAKLPA